MANSMKYQNSALTCQNPPGGAVRIAHIAFGIYFFFIFFGTILPFQAPVSEIEDMATSNVVNQIVFSSVTLACLPSVWLHRKKVLRIAKKEKFLTLFLLWCALSISWSPYPFVSFKRFFQILATVLVSLGALLPLQRSEELWPLFRPILHVYLLLSLFSVLAVPGAIDPKTLTWRGLAPSKNLLGQAALVATLFWFIDARKRGLYGMAIAIIMATMSLVLLAGSRSATSLITLVVIAAFSALVITDSRFAQLGVGRAFLAISTLLLSAFILCAVWLFPDAVSAFFSTIDRDITFTGRTDLWGMIWNEAQRHLFLGGGFGGFWVVENPRLVAIYEEFVWLPNQAHLGYLDILNETGVVGFLLLLSAMLDYSFRLIRFGAKTSWKWFVIAAVIINFQESTLFRQNVLTGVMFLFSYLAMYSDLAATGEKGPDAAPYGVPSPCPPT